MQPVFTDIQKNYVVYLFQFNAGLPSKSYEKSLFFRNFLNQEFKHMLPEKNIRITYNTFNKPIVQSKIYQSISISHTLDYLAVQLHHSLYAGIDIESNRNALLKVQHKFLQDDEMLWAKNNLSALCLLWTAKEALFKVYGLPAISFKKDILIKDIYWPYSIGKIKSNDTDNYFTLYSQKYNDLTITYVVKKN